MMYYSLYIYTIYIELIQLPVIFTNNWFHNRQRLFPTSGGGIFPRKRRETLRGAMKEDGLSPLLQRESKPSWLWKVLRPKRPPKTQKVPGEWELPWQHVQLKLQRVQWTKDRQNGLLRLGASDLCGQLYRISTEPLLTGASWASSL